MAKRSKLKRELASVQLIHQNKLNLIDIASNIFSFKNMPANIDIQKVNFWLIKYGKVAFFKDSYIDNFVCLPCCENSNVDVYGNPTSVIVSGENGYNFSLKKNEFILIYDNSIKTCLYPIICDYAERMALCDRIIDLNIFHQKNSRIFHVPKNQENSIKAFTSELDSFAENILTYDLLDIENLITQTPVVPFIADKVKEIKDKLYADFLQKIGIQNLTIQKKERVIRDEIYFSQGGTLVSKLSRFNARKTAIEKINSKFNLNIEIDIYDNYINEIINMGSDSDVFSE